MSRRNVVGGAARWREDAISGMEENIASVFVVACWPPLLVRNNDVTIMQTNNNLLNVQD